MKLHKTSFFSDLEDDYNPVDWSFANSNVSQEAEPSVPSKRTRKDKVVQQTNLTFGELGLAKPLVRACDQLGFISPTKIQAEAIPLVSKGFDALICAQTGSGKTGAFALPLLHRLLYRNKRLQATRMLVLSPTRELSQQTLSMIEAYTKVSDISSRVVFGGANSAKEIKQLQLCPDVLIGTPGRILDHIINSKDVSFDYVDFLVLDEADRLLDMGFKREVQEIIKKLPRDRQTVLASATLGKNVEGLAELALKNPVRVGKAGLPDTLKQVIVRLKEDKDRESIAFYLVKHQVQKDVIIFVKTKEQCHRLYLTLKLLGHKIGELHGNLTQQQRLNALTSFQNGEIEILVATDLAARGLDLPVEAVINLHIPEDLNKLLHRIGRTARAGKEGVSVSLCTPEERTKLRKAVKSSIPSLTIDQTKFEAAQQEYQELKHKVKITMAEERVEKEIQEAEKQTLRARNLIDYADEIYNRPKKRWIAEKPDKQEPKETTPKQPKMSRDIEGKVMRHKLMTQKYKAETKGIKMIHKHIEKANKKRKSKKPQKKRKF